MQIRRIGRTFGSETMPDLKDAGHRVEKLWHQVFAIVGSNV